MALLQHALQAPSVREHFHGRHGTITYKLFCNSLVLAQRFIPDVSCACNRWAPCTFNGDGQWTGRPDSGFLNCFPTLDILAPFSFSKLEITPLDFGLSTHLYAQHVLFEPWAARFSGSEYQRHITGGAYARPGLPLSASEPLSTASGGTGHSPLILHSPTSGAAFGRSWRPTESVSPRVRGLPEETTRASAATVSVGLLALRTRLCRIL